MTRVLRLLTAVSIVLVSEHAAFALESAGTVVKNGGFDEIRPDELPDQWTGGDARLAKVLKEGGSRFLRIAHETPSTTVITQDHAVVEWSTIHVSVRIRAHAVRKGPESWNSGCLQYIFMDPAGEHVGGWDKRLIERD
jgi:hypothetical protein